jgi:hypothetical protein
MSRRYELTDQQWNRIEAFLPGRPGNPGVHPEDNRRFTNAAIWVARTGAPWRDLPARFGLSRSVLRSTPPRPPVLDREQQAKVIALRLGPPPKGLADWTLRLPAEKVVELKIAKSVSRETGRSTLKKTA